MKTRQEETTGPVQVAAIDSGRKISATPRLASHTARPPVLIGSIYVTWTFTGDDRKMSTNDRPISFTSAAEESLKP
ncbi:hypothetical protein O3P69_003233 [Scylla paramamosain]|uniref:Uncharacterized protein n=1 Tax=Scylla paramamosain TaxID=85552 RepID=A0AAW0UJR2_SCYPA